MSDPSDVPLTPPMASSEAEGSASGPESEGAALQEVIAGLHGESAALAARFEEEQRRAERLERELGLALQRYRQALLEATPELPAELLVGATVAELEAAAVRARALVERVRSQVEAQMARGRVPAGAPPRRSPDLSVLSAREKIAVGLERR